MKWPPALLALAVALALASSFAPPARAAEKAQQDVAAEAFARGDYPAAIEAYRGLVERGIADPKLYYNLGTAYARAGDKGRAAWMLLKAKRLDPRDSDIRDNLRAVAPEAPAQVAVFPIPPLEAIYGLFTLNEWAWLGGLGALAFGLALAGTFRATKGRPLRGLLRKLAFFFAVVATVGHGFAFTKYWREHYTPLGIVVGKETQPRAAPDDGAAAYDFTLPPGTVIYVGQAGAPGWVKAIYGGRNEVFIRADQMEPL